MYKIHNVFCRWKLQRILSLLSFAPSLYTCYRRIIFTHRAIHSRLTTGDVTPLVPSVLFLSLFFLRLFLHRSPFHEMQVFPPCVSPRVEKKWPFLSPYAARVDRQSQGRSLWVFQIVVLYDELLPIVVLVSPASAKGKRKEGRRAASM